MILFWGFFVSPKAPRRLRDPLRLVSELVIFLGATAAFVEVGQTAVALVFGGLRGLLCRARSTLAGTGLGSETWATR